MAVADAWKQGFWKTGHWAPGYFVDGYWLLGGEAFVRPARGGTMHAALMRRAVNVLASNHGRTVIYTHPDGHTVQIQAIEVGDARDTLVRGDKGEHMALVRSVTFRRDSTHIHGGVEQIVIGGTVTIDDEDWSILNREHDSETYIQVNCGRDKVTESSSIEYRGV